MSLLLFTFTLMVFGTPVTGSNPPSPGSEALKIGLLVTDSLQSDIIRAASLAIEKANKQGGYNGQLFELVTRSTEGPWGAGSKKSVSLVYEENVLAIVGSLDGRNAHLAEQVAARSHITYLETRATDPTLSQAFVPWFFRVVPNDNQQASAIYNEIKRRGGGKTAILSNDQYDVGYAVKSLIEHAALEGGESPLILTPEPGSCFIRNMADQIRSKKIDHLVVPYYANFSTEFVQLLRKEMPGLQIYGTLAFNCEMGLYSKFRNAFDGMVLVRSTRETAAWSDYTCDGINLIIEAIRRGGPERESIKDQLLKIEDFSGVTGNVSFDAMGNRPDIPGLIQIRKGKIAPSD